MAIRLTFYLHTHILHTAVGYPEIMYDYGLKHALNYDILNFAWSTSSPLVLDT